MAAKMTGLAEMRAKIEQAKNSARTQARAAVETVANDMLDEAKVRVPVATGALRDSGRVEMVDDGRLIKATIVFGNEQVDYATIVHEDLARHHPHGQAKYLDSVMDEDSATVKARLAEKIEL